MRMLKLRGSLEGYLDPLRSLGNSTLYYKPGLGKENKGYKPL